MNVLYTWAEEYLKIVDKLWEQEKFSEGWSMLQTILHEEPGFAKAHNHAGWYAHYHLKDRKMARMHYEYALLFDPNLTWTYLNYAETLIAELDEKRMKELLVRGLEISELDKASLYSSVGRLLEMKEKYSEASAYYKAGMKFATNEYILTHIRRNRKRVRSKKRLFAAWYSKLL